MTQKELAHKSNIDQSYISALERNDRKKSPTLHVVESIAAAFGICPKDLLICECEKCS